jgi:ABC-type transporter lipoprotein component MlaA/pimeloyl-ACP methyl ester carboxylesterase
MKFHPPTSPTALSWLALVTTVTGLFTACSPVKLATTAPQPTKQNQGILPEFMADPFEPVNRGLWGVNHGLLVGVMQPSGRVYRAVVPPPARRSINHFTRNITYPTRLVNNVLQGRWSGAGDESLRFLCNTTAGVGGLFDVASKWNIAKSDADFGQTFTRWGWKPTTYVMLPLLGPSDETHAIGTAADELSEPWNYARPYIYGSYGTSYNRLTDQTEDAVQFIHTEADPYVGVKNIWTYVSKDSPPNWQAPGEKDPATLQTLAVALIEPKDPEFLQHGRIMSVRMPSTGRNMKFNYWLQKTHAPLVYISPGQGLHRESNTTLALAEMIYQSGYSVVTTTGVFHPDFMENASTADLPAYPPVDCHDMLVELSEFDRVLGKKHPGLFGKRALVGFSMGGFQALYLAAREKKADPGLLRFDRYVAIDTPVDLQFGFNSIDKCYSAPEAWPTAERQASINNALHKVASLGTLPAGSTGELPFNGIESKFLIGMSFRLTLRDTLFSSQIRHNMGVLQTPLSSWRRDPAYNEILQYTFNDYYLRFVLPYYKQRGVGMGDFNREVNLRSYQANLGSNPKVRVMVNQDDFILNPRDVSWLRSTFGPSKLTVFPNGGHIGNLTSPAVRKSVIGSLDGLK